MSLGKRYARALEELDRAEARLVRAFGKWNKARQRARRYERELDRTQAAGRRRDSAGAIEAAREFYDDALPGMCSAAIEGSQDRCTRSAGHSGDHRCSIAEWVDARRLRGVP